MLMGNVLKKKKYPKRIAYTKDGISEVSALNTYISTTIHGPDPA
jgi:hypothetical protein